MQLISIPWNNCKYIMLQTIKLPWYKGHVIIIPCMTVYMYSTNPVALHSTLINRKLNHESL